MQWERVLCTSTLTLTTYGGIDMPRGRKTALWQRSTTIPAGTRQTGSDDALAG